MKPTLAIVYATRFGSTRLLAETMAGAMVENGATPLLLNVDDDPPPPALPTILLTAIIWDRPLPAMRRWLARYGAQVRPHVLAAGVVCGSAGVREGGGMSYARRLAARWGHAGTVPFALSGQIPPREAMATWEWWMLKAFSRVMRKPQLFAIRADIAGAKSVGAAVVKR